MPEKPVDIEVEEVKQLLDKDEIVLIDCREEKEWQVAKIEGATLLPMSNWQLEAQKLPSLATKPIVVHCHHGGRSLRVTQWLRENGYPEAQNMAGGINAWSERVDPSVPTY